jgi:GNAT superfamily N-acetyltransferase
MPRRVRTTTGRARPSPAGRPAEGARAFRIRRATLADLPTLVRHRRTMFHELVRWKAGDLDRADPIYRRWLRAQIAERQVFAFVAEGPDGATLGTGVLWLQPSQPRPGRLSRPRMPYVMSMYTERSARHRGVASALVKVMIDWSTKHGYRRIFLHASKFGRPVYAALGFENGNEMRLELPARRRRSR